MAADIQPQLVARNNAPKPHDERASVFVPILRLRPPWRRRRRNRRSHRIMICKPSATSCQKVTSVSCVDCGPRAGRRDIDLAPMLRRDARGGDETDLDFYPLAAGVVSRIHIDLKTIEWRQRPPQRRPYAPPSGTRRRRGSERRARPTAAGMPSAADAKRGAHEPGGRHRLRRHLDAFRAGVGTDRQGTKPKLPWRGRRRKDARTLLCLAALHHVCERKGLWRW
mmetsp:Transcript_74951/g.208374  ORF Transcript_74951/g.208374 Transcript_74951/m.208374 type:complete len:224 (-) Transcript_74951:526-1197(-)